VIHVAQRTKPAIDPKRVVEIALELIERDGLEVLSVRKIAARLGVNAASLYYHFKDKDEILEAAAALAVKGIEFPRIDETHWRDWLVGASMAYNRHLEANRHFIPLIVGGHLSRTALPMYETVSGLLDRKGVPRETQAALLEAIEALTIGAAMLSDKSSGAGLYFGTAAGRWRREAIEKSFRLLVDGHLDGFRE
jgi:AcrR family transcriptional regulator